MAFEHDVLCALCRDNLQGAERVSDHEVWKCGELSYIELAHTACAVVDNRDAHPDRGWRWVHA